MHSYNIKYLEFYNWCLALFTLLAECIIYTPLKWRFNILNMFK